MERERKIYMNAVFFLPVYLLAMQTLGSPGECSPQQGWGEAESRDGCLCPLSVATDKGATAIS